MSRLHLLRVFCAEDGSGGNPLAVFLDGADVPADRRQAVAADLGLSETVFVDDADSGAIRIFTPAEELDFAGHPSVGTAWLLGDVPSLRPPAGEVPVGRDPRSPADAGQGAGGYDVYVTARPEWGPPWPLVELGTPEEVEALDGPPEGSDLVLTWAWIDEDSGTLRARAFGSRIGIFEDEATGSAATKLAAHAGRPVEIRQGRGSRIRARPADHGYVEIGGRSALDEVRDYTLV
jgi:predicted PhzF superfamily epimerase YddE/YHI9